MKTGQYKTKRRVMRWAGLCLLVLLSRADAVAIPGNVADSRIQRVLNPNSSFSFFQDSTAATTFSGYNSANVNHVGNGVTYNAVYVFQLPAGTGATSAHLSFVLSNRFGPFGGIDLYGLGYRASPTVLDSDFYVGALDAGAALIQNDMLGTGDPGGSLHGTTAGGDAALLAYINAQYTAGGAGSYVFLRLNPDIDLGTTSASYPNAGAELATAETVSPPILSIVVVPEPTSLALLGVGYAVALRRRRH